MEAGDNAHQKKPDNRDASVEESQVQQEVAGDSAKDSNKPTEEQVELVKRTHRIPLKAIITALGVKSMDKETRRVYENKLAHFDNLDKKRRELQRERNALEAYVYDARDKLESTDVISASTEEERESISSELSSVSDWLTEQEEATVADYRAKLKAVKDKVEKIYYRIKEKDALPEAVEQLKSTMNISGLILRNITEMFNVTEEERDRALKTITTTEEWLTTKFVEQNSVPAFKDPVLTSDEVLRKKADIEFQTKLLLRRPKKKAPVVDKSAEAKPVDANQESTDDKPTSDEQSAPEVPKQDNTEEGEEEADSQPETEKKPERDEL
jgi:heat shock protein 4